MDHEMKRRQDPTAWTAQGVRENPTEAFECLNVERTQQLTLPEIVVVPEDRAAALALLGKLGVPQNLTLQRPEFCDVVRDKQVFSDEAVSILVRLCSLRSEGDEAEEKSPECHEAAVLTTISLYRAARLQWRNEYFGRLKGGPPGTPCELVCELVAVDFTLVDSAWYDALNILGPVSASVFCVAYDADSHAELARTTSLTADLAAAWPPLNIGLDPPSGILFAVYALAKNVNIFIGKTKPVKVSELKADSSPTGPVVAVGPLNLRGPDNTTAGRLFGTQKWIRDPDLGHHPRAAPFFPDTCLAGSCI